MAPENPDTTLGLLSLLFGQAVVVAAGLTGVVKVRGNHVQGVAAIDHFFGHRGQAVGVHLAIQMQVGCCNFHSGQLVALLRDVIHHQCHGVEHVLGRPSTEAGY